MPNKNFLNIVDVLANKTDIEVVIEAISRLGIWITGVNPIEPESEPTDALIKYTGGNHFFNRSASPEAEHLISILQLYRDEVIKQFDPDDEHVQFVKKHFTKTTYGWQTANIALEFDQIKRDINPPLISINNLLFGYHRKKGMTHADIAWEIERNGIYMYGKFPSYTKISADSFHCASALTGLSAYYVSFNDERGMYEPYDSDPDADPTYLFGWPESEFAKFRRPNEETQIEYLDSFYRMETRVKAAFFKEDLYTLGRILLLTKAKVAMVASAMEKYGLYGYDNFGRVQYHDQSSVKHGAAYLKVHRPLSDYAASIIKKGVIDFDTLEHEVFSTFGWPKENLPDFNEFENNQPIINAPQVVTDAPLLAIETQPSGPLGNVETIPSVTVNLYIKTIAGLLWYIQGKTTANEHPDGSSQNKLIKNFIEALPRLPGANNAGDYKRLFAKINAQSHLMRTPAEVQEALLRAEKDSEPDT